MNELGVTPAAPAEDVIRCRVASPELPHLGALAAGQTVELMVLPAGLHEITPEINGVPMRATVQVDAASACELQKQLGILNGGRGNKRAFFDFDHEAKVASGWPQEFVWRDQPAPGVYARVELSEAGAKAITGKNYRSFSVAAPIRQGNPARIVASEKFPELSLGGLVNDPAFPTILPLWAKNAAGAQSSDPQTKTNIMTPEQIAALQAKNAELQSEITTLKAKQSRTELEDARLAARQAEHAANAAQIENATLKAQNADQAGVIKARATKDAEAAVADAIAKGKIPPQDATLKASWQKLCENDPTNIVLLAALPENPTLAAGRATEGKIEIQRESVSSVVKAYCAERNPLKRGILYARNLKSIMTDAIGYDDVIKAADTYSTTLIVQRTLEFLKWNYPMLGTITSDFSGEAANYGDAITTRYVGAITPGTYNTTTGWPTSAAGTTTDVAVTMNAHKGVPIFFDSEVLGSTRRRLYEEQVEAAYNAIAKVISDAVLALITTGNFTNTPVTAARVNFSRSTVIDLGQAMTEAKCPANGRTLLLNPSYYAALAEDTTVVSGLINNGAGSAIATGRLPNVHGFGIIEQGNLPTTGNLTGFGYTKSALVLATRVPADYTQVLPGAMHGSSQIVTNPEDGFSVMLVQYVDHTLAKAVWRISVMYGVAKGQVAAGTIIRSSA